MNVCCSCSWESMESFDIEGVSFTFNKLDSRAGALLDVQQPFSRLSAGFPADRRALVQTEPALHTEYYASVSPAALGAYYGLGILTTHRQILALPNGRLCHASAGKWVQPFEATEGREFGIGGFISSKFDQRFDGYVFRRKVIEAQSRIMVPSLVHNASGSWRGESRPYPEPRKDATMQRYMFHLAIENCREPGWFTEKLIDCFATMSVPLYYGAQDVANHFNRDGIIILDDDNFVDVINGLTPKDYAKRIPAMRDNFEASRKFWHHLGTWARGMRGLVGP